MWITWRALCWVKQAHSKKTSTACFCWYEVLRAIRSVEMESRMMVARGWGRSNRELKFNPYRTSMLQNEKGSKDDWEWWSHSFVNVLHTINCSLKMVQFSSVQFSGSVIALCDPMNHSTPGLPVYHQLSEFTQTQVHWISDPSNHLILCHPLLLPPSIFPNIMFFSNESVFHIRWPKVLEFHLQHQSFQWTPRTDLF